LTRHLSSENEFVVWADVLDVLRQIDAMERGESGQPAFRAYARALLQPVMKRVGWAPLASDKVETVLLRSRLISALGEFGDRAVISEARRRFNALRENKVPLPVELRGAILETVGRHADGKTFDQLHALAKAASSEEERRDLYWAMASAQDITLIDRTVEITKTNELSKDQLEWLLVISAQRSDAERVWYDIEQGRKDVLGGDLSGGLLSAVAEHSFDLEVAHQVPLDPAFASRKSVPLVVRQIEVQARLRSRISAGVARYLRHPRS
jgi:ERAP1-like C-terminal domain